LPIVSNELTMNQKEETLASIREKIILEHMDAEVNKSSVDTVHTFNHPRYEVVPTGEVYDGATEVKSFLEEGMLAFPDFTFETHHIHHAKDAVIVETTFNGTHLGAWRGIPATGKRVSYRMCNVFVFEKEKLVCERINFDVLTILTQLGITRDINSVGGKLALFLGKPLPFISAWVRQIF